MLAAEVSLLYWSALKFLVHNGQVNSVIPSVYWMSLVGLTQVRLLADLSYSVAHIVLWR